MKQQDSFNDLLSHTAVLGAAGKMGRGIALILLQEMAGSEAKILGTVGSGSYQLVLMDSNKEALSSLKKYLKEHLKKYAEKNIIALRRSFASNDSLVSNEEMIDYFLEGAMDIVQFSHSVEELDSAHIIFEAVIEDLEIKSALFRSIDQSSQKKPYFFSNTSSIPIDALNKKSGLENRIIGFHFYNPPTVQKLLELIPSENEKETPIYSLAQEVAKRLGKQVVESKDVAGFIGNGHFLREVAYAFTIVKELSARFAFFEAIYIVNKVTQDFLLRPMGIFQLMDYVGIDIVQKVGLIMNDHLGASFYDDKFLDRMFAAKKLGGQLPDGSSKDGFFHYQDHRIQAVYSPGETIYHSLAEPWRIKCDQFLGPFPEGHNSWKALKNDPNYQEKITRYLENLKSQQDEGAALAKRFLANSKAAADELVAANIAVNVQDVQTVLKNGFFHLF